MQHKPARFRPGRWAVTHHLVLSCSQDEWRFLLSGGTIKEMQENPAPDWLNERAWGDILALSNLKNFSGFANDFAASLAAFRAIFDSHEPHRQVSQALSVLLYCSRPTMASLEEHEVLIQPQYQLCSVQCWLELGLLALLLAQGRVQKQLLLCFALQ